MHPCIFNNTKYMLGIVSLKKGILKEVWRCGSLVNVYSGLLHPCVFGTFFWMLDHIFQNYIIVTYDIINDKTEVEIFIVYQLNNDMILNNFRGPTKALWTIKLFHLFSNIIWSIKTFAGHQIHKNTNKTLGCITND